MSKPRTPYVDQKDSNKNKTSEENVINYRTEKRRMSSYTSIGIEIINGESNTEYKEDEFGVITTETKTYFPIRAFRDSRCGNIRIANYYCQLHQKEGKIVYKIIGQMDAIARHYIREHPDRLIDLKPLMGKQEFMISRCRLLLDKLETCTGNYLVDFKGNLRDILTLMSFDYKTGIFLDEYSNSKFNNPVGFSNVNTEMIRAYLEICHLHVGRFLFFMDKEPYICPYSKKIDEDENEIKFENFTELDYYKFKDKRAFFFISEKDNDDDLHEQNKNRQFKNMIKLDKNSYVPTEFEKSDEKNKGKESEEYELNSEDNINPDNTYNKDLISSLKESLKPTENPYINVIKVSDKNEYVTRENILTKDYIEYLNNKSTFEKWKRSRNYKNIKNKRNNLKERKVSKRRKISLKKIKKEKEEINNDNEIKKIKTKLDTIFDTISLNEEEENKKIKIKSEKSKKKTSNKKEETTMYLRRKKKFEDNVSEQPIKRKIIEEINTDVEIKEQTKLSIQINRNDILKFDYINEPNKGKEIKGNNIISEENNMQEDNNNEPILKDIYEKSEKDIIQNINKEVMKTIKDIVPDEKKENKNLKSIEKQNIEFINNVFFKEVNKQKIQEKNISIKKQEDNIDVLKPEEKQKEKEKELIIHEQITPKEKEKTIEEKPNNQLEMKKKEENKNLSYQTPKKDINNNDVKKQSNLDTFVKKEIKETKPVLNLNDIILKFNMEFSKQKNMPHEENMNNNNMSKMGLRSHGRKSNKNE